MATEGTITHITITTVIMGITATTAPVTTFTTTSTLPVKAGIILTCGENAPGTHSPTGQCHRCDITWATIF